MTSNIIEKYGTISRYCKIKGWNYSSFKTSKYTCFTTPLGQRMLETLKADGLIDEETYLKYKRVDK